MNGAQRLIEADARDRERLRAADLIIAEVVRREGADPRSRDGRLRQGLEYALQILPRPRYSSEGPWTELIGSVSSQCDGIDVGVNLEPDGEEYDILPFRIVVDDGCDSTTAYAYLGEAELDELIDLLQHAKKTWGARPPLPKERNDNTEQGLAGEPGPHAGR